MKLKAICTECSRVPVFKITGPDSGIVTRLRRHLFLTHLLCGLAGGALGVRVIQAVIQFDSVQYSLRLGHLLGELVEVLIFIGVLVGTCLLESAFWVRHGEREFDVEVDDS